MSAELVAMQLWDASKFEIDVNYFAGNPPLILPGGVFAGDARCNRTEDAGCTGKEKKLNIKDTIKKHT